MAGMVLNSVAGKMTLSGGTRLSVKTSRPWQPKLVFPASRADCPFCTERKNDGYSPVEGWRVFQNANTPHSYHNLLIPVDCWDENKLRSLGGLETFGLAVQLAFEEVRRTRSPMWPTWIYTHIGYGAGQNLTHHHWHLHSAPTEPRPPFKAGELPEDRAVLFGTQDTLAVVCGVRAGQTFIIPRGRASCGVLYGLESASKLISAAYRVVDLFNRKFNYPDYCLLFAQNGATDFHVRYTPILNNWGGSEFAALDYGTPFTLPWPHKTTVEFLKEGN